MTAIYLPGQMDLPETEPTSKQWLHYRSDTMLRRAVEQKPCDIGLFSDETNQLDLIEMLQEPLDC